MSVKSGYKQTEIGIIPENWEVVPLNNLVYRPLAYGVLKPGEYEDNGVYMLRIQDIKTKNIDYKSLFRIPKSLDLEFKRTKLKEGDLILSLVGTIGKVLKINNKLAGANVTRAFGVIGIKEKESVDYIEQYLSSHFMQKWIQDQSKGNAQKVLNIENIKKMPIIYPTLEEQKKIADILSTVDKKIAFVEENINATEELKKGLMQKLLTEGIGHTEFKDSELGTIPESWEILKLSEICKIKMGQSPKSESYNENNIGLPLIQGNADIKNRKTLPRTYTSDITKKCEIGDIIMTVRAPVGAIAKSYHNACIGRGVCAITPEEDNDFLYHFLVGYEDKWDKLSQGSTFTAVNRNDIKNIKLSYPLLEEQKQIAEILSTVDNKLENLKEKKQYFEELKKGLMQKLLTGEVRV